MIKLNEEFICENCNKKVVHAEKTCRNHCNHCLFSKHLDDKIPGDRASNCHSLMKPKSLDYNGKKGYIIIHECKKCGKTINNKTLPDDNLDKRIELSSFKYS